MQVSMPSEVHTSSAQQNFKVCKFYVKMHSPVSDQHAEYNMTNHILIGVIQHLFGHNYLQLQSPLSQCFHYGFIQNNEHFPTSIPNKRIFSHFDLM